MLRRNKRVIGAVNRTGGWHQNKGIVVVLRCIRLGNLDLDFEIPISDFAIRFWISWHEVQKRISPFNLIYSVLVDQCGEKFRI